ncbi:hypothetical protein HD597_005547 [Nonomuraea thailandensis]|uniref:Uncharacterized protein n=1 Tax=Nonomuraea thailandensis TaxID=1188745 RepID=A0A9X2GIV9_9ACTN|nr:hypothetical protein [Nonomuraea thailandensis]MCP2358527.1 hypothetical protein [Nonomuraea thailandensis]
MEPHHGTWHGKAEVPAGPDGKRIYLRLGGFATHTELSAFYEKAGCLLDLPDPGPAGHQARMEILAMIKAAHRKNAPLTMRSCSASSGPGNRCSR